MQLFDISTTVDPSYIISLIRKLLPSNVGNGHVDGRDVPSKKLNADPVEESTDSLSGDRVLSSPKHNFKAMDVVDCADRSYCEGEAEDPCSKLEQADVSAGEEAWEEYGCVLWDLAASVTHAELMVLKFDLLWILLYFLFFLLKFMFRIIHLGLSCFIKQLLHVQIMKK